jgi:predicted RNA-binding Zn-ribbon protein involved in translation (DUF1610 family)
VQKKVRRSTFRKRNVRCESFFFFFSALFDDIFVVPPLTKKVVRMGDAAGAFEPPEGAKVQLEFDATYANFKVERKPDEIGDKNFPGSLHNVAELFGSLRMVAHLRNLHKCVEQFKTILKEGPDGKQTNGMGQAIVCFNCGFVALPKGGDVGMECANCGEKEQTNKVVCKQKDGSIVPFIENRAKPMSEEERRKKIEADVAMARKLQSLGESGGGGRGGGNG